MPVETESTIFSSPGDGPESLSFRPDLRPVFWERRILGLLMMVDGLSLFLGIHGPGSVLYHDLFVSKRYQKKAQEAIDRQVEVARQSVIALSNTELWNAHEYVTRAKAHIDFDRAMSDDGTVTISNADALHAVLEAEIARRGLNRASSS